MKRRYFGEIFDREEEQLRSIKFCEIGHRTLIADKHVGPLYLEYAKRLCPLGVR